MYCDPFIYFSKPFFFLYSLFFLILFLSLEEFSGYTGLPPDRPTSIDSSLATVTLFWQPLIKIRKPFVSYPQSLSSWPPASLGHRPFFHSFGFVVNLNFVVIWFCRKRIRENGQGLILQKQLTIEKIKRRNENKDFFEISFPFTRTKRKPTTHLFTLPNIYRLAGV